MKTKLTTLLTLGLSAAATLAQSSAFTYQGRLNDGANPANGIYDLRFAIYDAPADGNQLGGVLTNAATAVSSGLFTVTLDFGAGVFTGADRWLEIAVHLVGGGAFSTLSPRQALTATPHAIYAPNAGSAFTAASVPAPSITGTIPLAQLSPAVVTNGATGLSLGGSFRGNGGGLTDVPGALHWQSVAGSNVMAAPNQGYRLTNDAFNIVTLPGTANVGDLVTVSCTGSSGWLVADSGPTIPGHMGAGAFWTPQNSASAEWYSIALSADGTKAAAVAYNGRIHTSTNGGITWTEQNTPIAFWRSIASSADGTKLVAAVANGPLYTSTDSGITWTLRKNDGIYWTSVASSADGTKLVAVTINYWGIYTSTDSGVTWTRFRTDFLNWSCVASSADGTKLVACADQGPIYTSTDSGITWAEQIIESHEWSGVASSADGTKLVACSYDGPIYTSSDSGVTWTARTSTSSWAGVASSADGTRLIAADYDSGLLYTSSDSGVSWVARNSGQLYWDCVASSADGTRLAAGLWRAPIYTSELSADFGGGPGTTAQLQYLGNGIWQAVTPSPDTLPATLLTNHASGVNLSGGFIGNGSGLAVLNADNLISGTVPDARLSSNVALLARNQTFSGANAFTSAGNSFTGNGAGLTNLSAANFASGKVPDARLSTNVILLNVNQTFLGPVGIRTNSNADDALNLGDTLRLNDHNLWLRGGSDTNHGIGWYGSGKSFASQQPDGPALFGYGGGALGTERNGSEFVALEWTFSGVTVHGTFNNLSDRNAKQDFAPANAAEILEKVAQLPITTWSYKCDPATRHIGPTAQDFYAAFQVGTDERHIAPIDESGVTLAAIQGLNRKVEARGQRSKASLEALRSGSAELRQRLESLEHLLDHRRIGGAK